MRNARKFTLTAGTLALVLAATGLAAQDQKPAPQPQAPMMGQGQGMMPMMGMMQQMGQMMETCNKMMQAHMSQPQQPQTKQ
jgi:protein CpxP